MGRTRRSGRTAGEALPLQLHIAGSQKGVGPFSNGVPPLPAQGRSHRRFRPGGRRGSFCATPWHAWGCPASGHEQVIVLRSEGPECRS